MDKILEVIEYILIILSPFWGSADNSPYLTETFEASYSSLGIPLESYYETGIPARTAWDVEIFDQQLFVGSGDYDANSGPVEIYSYDLQTENWEHSGTLPDEQADRLIIIDDTLMIPGCDPRGSWEYGNLYRYSDDQWQTLRNIPGGIHQFDMIQYENALFVGLGVSPGNSPIVVSHDGGNTFQAVPMYKEGQLLYESVGTNTLARIYDFFILNNELYAFYYQYSVDNRAMEIFRYESNAFHYHSSLPEELSYKRTSYKIFNAKLNFDSKVYFSTGNLYVTDDLKTARKITLGDHEIVTDLRMIDGNLYVCSIAENSDGSYRTSIWVKYPYSTDRFKKVFYFSFDCPAQSFTYRDGIFYFGTGDGILSEENSSNGTILTVDCNKKQRGAD